MKYLFWTVSAVSLVALASASYATTVPPTNPLSATAPSNEPLGSPGAGLTFPSSTVGFPQGDANGDWKIDGADLAIWQQNYNPFGDGTPLGFDRADWNADGNVDGADLALWQQNYDPLGSAPEQPQGGHAPEPLTVAGMLMGLAFIATRKRTRKLF